MKKRRLNPKLKKPLIVIGVIFAIILVAKIWPFSDSSKTIKSIHSDAKKYTSGSCVVFYPNSDYGKKNAKDICAKLEDQEATLDYALIPYGDYYLVDYGSGFKYYADSKYKEIKVNSFSEEGIQVLSDYLRYSMKRSENEDIYTSESIKETHYKNLDISECQFNIQDSNLSVYFPSYNQTVLIPLKFCQKYIGINMGYEDENYIKPSYVSSKRKMIALTFDESPNTATSRDLINLLDEYDCNATFFVVGQRLSGSTIDVIKDSIERGNQIGSGTETYTNLAFVPDEEVYNEIYGPVKDVYYGYTSSDGFGFDGLGYMMSVYRAPYGTRNKVIDELAPFISIEWDLDTYDKELQDKEAIKEKVYRFESLNPDELDGCIIRMHEGVSQSVEALKELIPELIDKGYQFVTVDDLLASLGIDKTSRKYYPW